MFIRSRTSARPGSGTSRANASVDGPDGEELKGPAEGLEEDRRDGGAGRAEHCEALPRHRQQPARSALSSCAGRTCGAPGGQTATGSMPDPDERRRADARDRPVGELRGRHHVGDEEQRSGRDRRGGARTPCRGASRSCPCRAGDGGGSTATRASSPVRGREAPRSPSSPTPNDGERPRGTAGAGAASPGGSQGAMPTRARPPRAG